MYTKARFSYVRSVILCQIYVKIFANITRSKTFRLFTLYASIHERKINDCFYFDVTRNEGSLDTLHYLAEK